MYMVYKLLVQCLPDTHLKKVQQLVSACFFKHVSLDKLRSYDYGIVLQLQTVYVAVLLVRVELDTNTHVVDLVCVDKSQRNKGYGSEIVSFFIEELSTSSQARVKINFADTKLLSFFIRQGFEKNEFSDTGILTYRK
jgi:predicted GNAT family N-acyltransferase